MSHAVLAQVIRSGFVESEHLGSVVGLGADGAPVVQAGAPRQPIFPRSASKPLQLAGMLRAGLDQLPDLDEEMLALAAASHSGEPEHRAGVRRLLAAAGLSELDLRNTPDLPSGVLERARWRREGRAPTALAMNCSGKHAAMIATCVLRGWSLEDYLEPAHPLQVALDNTVVELAGEQSDMVAVDGCGAPLIALSVSGLARAFARVASAEPGTLEERVAGAMRNHPWLVGGTGRDVTDLMERVPGLIAKDGAEGVYVAALPDGRAVAVKIWDGAIRPRLPVLITALRYLGVDVSGLDAYASVPVLGGGEVVGEIRPMLSPYDEPPPASTSGRLRTPSPSGASAPHSAANGSSPPGVVPTPRLSAGPGA